MAESCVACGSPHYAHGLCKQHYNKARTALRRDDGIAAGSDFLSVSPSASELERRRTALRTLHCPVCGAGPFKVPLTHVQRVHGIDRFTARVACGMLLSEQLTSPETHDKLAAAARVTLTDDIRGTKPHAPNVHDSPKANDVWGGSLRTWQESNPDLAAVQRKAAGALAGAANRALTPRWARFVNEYLSAAVGPVFASELLPVMRREGFTGSYAAVSRYLLLVRGRIHRDNRIASR